MRHLIINCVVVVVLPIIVSGATHQVDMINFAFVPDTLNINQGDSVLWINTTAIGHTTTSGVNGVPDGYWDSGLMAANDSFAFEFDSAGSFPYYCTPHWTLGMVGLIIVDPVGVQEYEYDVPGEVEIGKVYPNPFNGTTVITYSLEIPHRVQVGIFNAAGQNVRVLADATMPSGTYTALWDGRDASGNQVASGTYFVQVSLGDRYVERKVLLLR
jgi:plastocyanin